MSERPPPQDLLVRAGVAAFAGFLLSLLVDPWGWHLLHWVAYLPMFAVLYDDRPRANALLGWIYGIVGVGSIFWWISETIIRFTNMGSLLAVGVLALFSAAFSLTYPILWASVHPLRRRLGDGWLVVFPALQVALEYVSQFVLLFPYNHGVTQYRVPWTWQLTSVTGVAGLTFLLFFWNSVLAEALFRLRDGRPFPVRWLSAAVSVVSLVVIFGAWRFEQVEATLRAAPTFTVAQLQTARTMEERLSKPARAAFEYWVDRTLTIPPGSVDLVVWPEGAAPYSLQQPKAAEVFSRLAKAGKYEIIVGSGARDRVPGTNQKTGMVSFNAVYHVSKTGEITGRYDKMVPIPFGEYMPLKRSPVGFLVDWIQGPGDFQAGDRAVVLGDTLKYATPICYEAILPSTCEKFAGYDLFVTVTNDAWFGDTAAPAQHGMLAAVRAVELGAPMVRGAYTGVSFVAEPHGVLHSETRAFQESGQKVTVRRARVPTVYSWFPGWFSYLCVAVVLGAVGWARWGRGSPPSAG